LQSLDIFRGITMVGMLLVNNLTDEEHSYAPLLHSNWHGWTPTDLIFPFFMFIVGVAIPFSMAKRTSDPTQTRTGLLAHVWSRALALVMLGFLVHIVYSGTPPLPPGYPMLHVMRWAAMILGYGGIIALLAPIRSQRVSNLLPPIIAALFVLLIVVMHFIVRRETDSGLAQSVIGGGIFEPHKFRIPGVLQRRCWGFCSGSGCVEVTRQILRSARACWPWACSSRFLASA
jgi:predicted acyltransferase